MELIEIFKEMLIYKNQKYDDNWNFRQWVEKTYENYTFYKEMLSNILSQTESNIFCRKIIIPRLYNKLCLQWKKHINYC